MEMSFCGECFGNKLFAFHESNDFYNEHAKL